jgi:hypothetical protein
VGGSYNYRRACRSGNLLRTEEVAAVLGVSASWVRAHVEADEWHHCNLKYGGRAVAYFYSLYSVVSVLRDPALAKHLERAHLRGKPEVLARWIVDRKLDDADDPLPVPAWLAPYVHARQAWHETQRAKARARRAEHRGEAV